MSLSYTTNLTSQTEVPGLLVENRSTQENIFLATTFLGYPKFPVPRAGKAIDPNPLSLVFCRQAFIKFSITYSKIICFDKYKDAF
jgi:hypothetical protein